MRPLHDWPLADRRPIVGVFTDIDDTLTTDGAITPDALAALAALKAAGLAVVPITGRPAGWSQPFAWGDTARNLPPWPVDAIVAENGAVALLNHSQNGLDPLSNGHRLLSKIYQQSDVERHLNYARMQAVAQRILREVPGSRLAEDSPGRETDIAIDHAEFHRLNEAQIATVVALMQAEGMTATVSSIHINGWYGDHNKLHGARWIVQSLYGRDLMAELDRWVYVGDSTNDQLMFQTFAHSFGVANVRQFEHQLVHRPRYITPSERGAGFAEVAQALLAGHP